MSGQTVEGALPSARRYYPPSWLGWAAATGAAGIAAAWGAAPFVILALILAVATATGVLHSPLVFLCLITAVSGLGLGWTDAAALSLGGVSINVNGLQWALIMAAAAVILVRQGAATVPYPLRGWLALTALAGAGILWAPDRFEAMKQFLLYLGPVLTGAVAYSVADRRGMAALQAALYAGAALAIGLGVVMTLGGDLLGGPLDPDGRPMHRALGTFLLPVTALAMARMRFGDGRQVLLLVVILLAVVASESRTTLAAMALLGGLVALGSGWRVRAAVVATAVLGTAVVLSYEPLRERVFADSRTGFTAQVGLSGRGESAELQVGGLQLSGRGMIWIQTAYHGMRAPWLGHGTGSSTKFVAERTRGEALFPHNEYLRVFHDFGAVGVAALLAAFGMVLISMRRIRRHAASRETRVLAYAASLSWIGFAFIAVFDNPLGYFVFFTHNVFLLTALALRSARMDDTTVQARVLVGQATAPTGRPA
ncbi:MAG TPA: O-antigen ligase family protein [Longimicrobiales bacterium]|nr:O-antigen ligase family protein [Longimicrobiales bacterium]